MTANLNALSLALIAVAAVAYARHRRFALTAAAVLFFPVTGAATVMSWYATSPTLAVVILAATLGVSLVALALIGIDVTWAPFGVQMTYGAALCWLLCPAAVLLNYVGMAVQGALGPQ